MSFLKEPAKRDTVNPKALLDFMMKDWKPQSRKLPKAHKQAAAFRERRARLSKLFPGDVLVIPTGHEQVRANDTHYRFRPGSDFFWLTGNHEPDCVLIMVPTKKGHDAHLFVEPNPGRSNETFYTNRQKGELWVGPRFGVPESQAFFGVEFAHPFEELPAFLNKYPLSRTLRGLSEHVDSLRSPNHERPGDKELATAISELRLLKDKAEVAELQKVIDATQRGFEDVIRALGNAKSEREVEGHFGFRARVEGNDVGYGTIAAAGAHACILHWTRNDGALNKKDLLLLDAGVEGHQLYTADITRTLPMSGKFSKEQREIYELVWRAQQAAFEAVKPGNDFMEPNRRAMRVLAEGLVKLGILKVSADEALEDQHQFYKRYSLHNVSHMLGLDVHDCAKARQEVYRYGPLQPGMVLTVEPGLYFQLDDLTVPAKYRGIGVRIEDDLLVTAKGFKNLSAAIPSEARAVEKWMKSIKLGVKRR
ncbi:MAG: Xaa-Pro aminopeptidase [Archangium gephyra]|uniref:Xaa-Pro aminopeptidase n=1 Tax=Archangium gephyra TaxID=48 RepID=A0A2W5SPY1_9BACT|nr:MAG: Xaa-Pro aminopeptidase [Archangium gephyra]